MRTPDLRAVATVRPPQSRSIGLPTGLAVPAWLAPATGVGGLVILALALLLGTTLHAQAGQRAQLADITRQLQDLHGAPPPSCAPAAIWLGTITRLEEAGDWETAFTNAQTALTDPTMCPGDRPVLVQEMLRSGVEALFAAPLSPTDEAAQQHAVAHYFALQRLAREHQSTLPLSARQTAGRAYTTQAFLLAQTALEEAMQGRTPPPLEDLELYTDTLYNRGAWGAQREHGLLQAKGLSYLAAAWQLNERYHLGREQPADLLRTLLGADTRFWPTPAAIPLLATPTAPAVGQEQ